jgi:hypothetical protein
LVRGRLEALINRPAFYELVEHARTIERDGRKVLVVASNGAEFELGSVE